MKTYECESTPGCIKAALAILGDKWSPLLLKELAENGATRFSSLEKSLVGISPRTLSQRLDMLESESIIERLQYSTTPPRFEYSLTQKGADLVGVLVSMGKWGAKYSPQSSIAHIA